MTDQPREYISPISVVPSRPTPTKSLALDKEKNVSDFANQQNNFTGLGGSAFESVGSGKSGDDVNSRLEYDMKQPLYNLLDEPRPTFSPGPMLSSEFMRRGGDSREYCYSSDKSAAPTGRTFMQTPGHQRKSYVDDAGENTSTLRTTTSSGSATYGQSAFSFESPLSAAREENQYQREIRSQQDSQEVHKQDHQRNHIQQGQQQSQPQLEVSDQQDFFRLVDRIMVGLGDGDTWGQMGTSSYSPYSSSNIPSGAGVGVEGIMFDCDPSGVHGNANSASVEVPPPIGLHRGRSVPTKQPRSYFGGVHKGDEFPQALMQSSFSSDGFEPFRLASEQPDLGYLSSDYAPSSAQETSRYFGEVFIDDAGVGIRTEILGAKGQGRNDCTDVENIQYESSQSNEDNVGRNPFVGLDMNRNDWSSTHSDVHQQSQPKEPQNRVDVGQTSSTEMSVSTSFGRPPRSVSPTSFQQDRFNGDSGNNNAWKNVHRRGGLQSNYSNGQQSNLGSADVRYSNRNTSATAGSQIKPKWASSEPQTVNLNMRKHQHSDFHDAAFGSRDSAEKEAIRRDRDRAYKGSVSTMGQGGNDVTTSSTVRTSGGGGSVHSSGGGKYTIVSESPQAKAACKEFIKNVRLKERESLESARQYAETALQWIAESSRWKVYAEMADLAKRSDQFEKARELYKTVCYLQPMNSQSWLEWSKLEEECGEIRSSLKVLRKGLLTCTFNEALLTKAIKQQERLNNVDDARKMLSVLKHEAIDRVWKSMLEGALLEARAGRILLTFLFNSFS